MQVCVPAVEHYTQLLDGTFHNKSRTSLIPKQMCSAYNDKVTEWYEDILTCCIYQNMPDWQTGTDAKKHVSTESNAHLLWVDTDGM